MRTLKSIFALSTGFAVLAGAATAASQNSTPALPIAQVMTAFSHPQTVEADLARLDAALNSITNFEGRFTQYNPDGQTDTGKVFLSRPGRMRFEYDAPNPLLVVTDGVTLVQHDKELETTDRVPLSATPLNYFLKEDVQLARDTEIVSLIKTEDQIRLTARDGSGEMDGDISMVFDPNTLAFRAWVIGDSFGGQTQVVLSDLKYNGRLDPRLFVYREDNRRDRRRR